MIFRDSLVLAFVLYVNVVVKAFEANETACSVCTCYARSTCDEDPNNHFYDSVKNTACKSGIIGEFLDALAALWSDVGRRVVQLELVGVKRTVCPLPSFMIQNDLTPLRSQPLFLFVIFLRLQTAGAWA